MADEKNPIDVGTLPEYTPFSNALREASHLYVHLILAIMKAWEGADRGVVCMPRLYTLAERLVFKIMLNESKWYAMQMMADEDSETIKDCCIVCGLEHERPEYRIGAECYAINGNMFAMHALEDELRARCEEEERAALEKISKSTGLPPELIQMMTGLPPELIQMMKEAAKGEATIKVMPITSETLSDMLGGDDSDGLRN